MFCFVLFWVLDLASPLPLRFPLGLPYPTFRNSLSSLSFLYFPQLQSPVTTGALSLALQNTIFWPTLLFTNLREKSYVLDSSSHTFIRMYYTHSNKQPEGRTVSFTLQYARGQVQNLFYIKDFSKHLLNSTV